ncbi:hypothetical protein [Mycobacterium intracellulare]|uniref:hypothetical protein n=1 Tax=Mycobacterium intracellulare TaxID=1767 RepID=UPI00080B36D7|nr:hypothetical protein [Mycobacterium intracellulare]OCB15068.1 hypothetical protein A5689_26800 [Mycobacterium intracellulare subsp. yongonense]
MHQISILRYDRSDSRLGRHVHHDSRSLGYEFLPRRAKPKGKNTLWGSSIAPLNQGQLGSCTGNATAQWLNTDFAAAVRKSTNKGRALTEKDAVKIYSLGTTLDNQAGQYPPDDTGCDGISVAKAGVKLGYLDKYSHTFSFTALQAALEKTPVIVGTLWTNTMMTPKNGLVKIGRLTNSNIAGGHEYLGCGIDFTEEVIIFRNSWGDQDAWPGCKPGGYFAIGFADYQKLLAEQGDATILHGKETA